MDFTRLMMITGMTMKELKAVPKKSLSTVIKSMKDRLENIWYPAPKREEIEYQIACYEELFLTAR